MSDAHLHKLQILQLCRGNPEAIHVMRALQHEYQMSEDYYKCCNHLVKNKIFGDVLYRLWKDDCNKDYGKFLKYYF